MAKGVSVSKISSALPGWLSYDSSKDGSAVEVTSSDVTTTNIPYPYTLRLSDTLAISFYAKNDSDLYAKTLSVSGSTITVGGTENKLKDITAPNALYRNVHAARLSDTKFIAVYFIFDGTSTYTLYARTFTVSGDVISADAAEVSIGATSSSDAPAVFATSATRAIVCYNASGSNQVVSLGMQIGSGTLAKDGAASSAGGSSLASGRIINQEDSNTVAVITGTGAYVKFNFDATTTTVVTSVLTLTRFSFGSSVAVDIKGFSLLKHPSADNRMVALIHCGSGDMSQATTQTYVAMIDTSSTAVLALAKMPDIGSSFYILSNADPATPVDNLGFFTVGGKYFFIIPSWSTDNNASNGYYEGFTIVMLDWASDLPVVKVVAKDISGNGTHVESPNLAPPQITKLTETSFIYTFQDESAESLKVKLCQI